MSTIIYIIIFTFVGSIFSLVGGMILLAKEKLALKLSHFLASFAAGTLLGAAFFDLLPEAAHAAKEKNIDIFLWTLIGILLFFLLERFIHWFHHHQEYHEHEKESKTTVPLIVLSDTIHNFIDGLVIASTFFISIPLGIVTALAVAAHEIPQEIGDFGLLLHKGVARKKIILINLLSASSAFLGAFLGIVLTDVSEAYIPYALALTSGFFIYIAASDLIPEIHYEKRKGFALIETALLIIGVIIVWIFVTVIESLFKL